MEQVEQVGEGGAQGGQVTAQQPGLRRPHRCDPVPVDEHFERPEYAELEGRRRQDRGHGSALLPAQPSRNTRGGRCPDGPEPGGAPTPAGLLPASGRPFEFRATVWQDWEHGRIVQERHHLDVLTMMAQLGALPAPASA
ncbi:MAG: ester cyclase [Pseudonocardia sp.]|nr:ester cyclase [Pseudonocardia sp.]